MLEQTPIGIMKMKEKKIQGRLDWYSVPLTIELWTTSTKGSLELDDHFGPEIHFGAGGILLSKPSTASATDTALAFVMNDRASQSTSRF
jgi:hypothetical protein